MIAQSQAWAGTIKQTHYKRTQSFTNHVKLSHAAKKKLSHELHRQDEKAPGHNTHTSCAPRVVRKNHEILPHDIVYLLPSQRLIALCKSRQFRNLNLNPRARDARPTLPLHYARIETAPAAGCVRRARLTKKPVFLGTTDKDVDYAYT